MAVVNLKSEKRLKKVPTSGGGAENANTYVAGDYVYCSAENKFKQSNGSAWSDLTVPATVSDIGTIGNVDAIGSDANRGKFLKVKTGADEIEYVAATIPTSFGTLSDVDAFAGGNADQGKMAVVKEGADQIDFIPLHAFHEITVAVSAGSNTAITTELNSSLGGTIIIKNTGNASDGETNGKCVQVNVASLTAHRKSKPRFEIMSGLAGVGFIFKADTTAIDAFGGGQAQIAAGVGDSDGLSISDSQKLVLMCVDGTNWKYMVQSI